MAPAKKKKTAPPDDVRDTLAQILKESHVRPKPGLLGRLQIFVVKREADAQVRGAHHAIKTLKEEED